MNSYLAITRALSDPNRVRALCALRGGELCVCQLIVLTGLAPSTVSKHMAILRQADLVQSRKEGRWVYYRLPSRTATGVASRMAKETFRALADSPAIADDDERLESIRKAALEALCRRLLSKD